MPPDELLLAATKVLITINVITGWALQEDEKYADEFEKQFSLKLKEDYDTVNADEMEHAFRSNRTVKDWGKSLNLLMVEEVMYPYLESRREISKIEEQLMIKKELPAPVEEFTDDEIIDMSRDIFKSTGMWQLIYVKAYGILGRRKLLEFTDEEKKGIRLEVRFKIDAMYAADQILFQGTSREAMNDNFCKKLAVSKYFLSESNIL